MSDKNRLKLHFQLFMPSKAQKIDSINFKSSTGNFQENFQIEQLATKLFAKHRKIISFGRILRKMQKMSKDSYKTLIKRKKITVFESHLNLNMAENFRKIVLNPNFIQLVIFENLLIQIKLADLYLLLNCLALI